MFKRQKKEVSEDMYIKLGASRLGKLTNICLNFIDSSCNTLVMVLITFML